jgi:hypothetical protein
VVLGVDAPCHPNHTVLRCPQGDQGCWAWTEAECPKRGSAPKGVFSRQDWWLGTMFYPPSSRWVLGSIVAGGSEGVQVQLSLCGPQRGLASPWWSLATGRRHCARKSFGFMQMRCKWAGDVQNFRKWPLVESGMGQRWVTRYQESRKGVKRAGAQAPAPRGHVLRILSVTCLGGPLREGVRVPPHPCRAIFLLGPLVEPLQAWLAPVTAVTPRHHSHPQGLTAPCARACREESRSHGQVCGGSVLRDVSPMG